MLKTGARVKLNNLPYKFTNLIFNPSIELFESLFPFSYPFLVVHNVQDIFSRLPPLYRRLMVTLIPLVIHRNGRCVIK